MIHALARRAILPLFVSFSFLLASCSTIATFDRTAYEKATNAKAAASAIMNMATDSYASREEVVTPLLLQVDQAYEYDRGRALNSITVRQWNILRDPNGHLFGGFMRRWREKDRLRPAFIEEKKKDIDEAFDQIIQLERGKRVVTTTP
jgi:hypothetical protein